MRQRSKGGTRLLSAPSSTLFQAEGGSSPLPTRLVFAFVRDFFPAGGCGVAVMGADDTLRSTQEATLRRLVSACVVLALSSMSCTPLESYVQADRATFDVIAPAYLMYVQMDAGLDAEQRARRERLVDSWLIRLVQAEGDR